MRKFVCTSLRPVPPPSRELYEARACARFLASHLTYEPLDPPDAVPADTVKASDLNADLHGSAEYRAHLITVMTKRAVTQALGK